MDQDKVNPFVGNAETSAGGSPVSVPSSTPVSSTPVNPYAPAGAPYAPGSNTPTPSYATPMQSLNGPAVPNTSASSNDFAFTAISPTPEKPKLFSKKFLILAGIGVALIIAAVVTGIILQNNRGNNKNNTSGATVAQTPPVSSQEATVRKLANLLISGNESVDIPNFKATTWYISAQLVSARDENNSVMDNYLSEVKGLIGELPSDKTANINSHISTYANCLSLDYYENDEAANTCLSSAEAIKNDIQEIYSQISSGAKS